MKCLLTLTIVFTVCLFFVARADTTAAERVMGGSECIELGGEIINIFSDKEYCPDDEVLGKVIGMRCPCVCCKKENSEDEKELQEEPVFCTADAKECPDGSYVRRVPPDCEFEKCLNKGELEKSQEGNPCLQDKDCKMIDCTEAIKNNQGCDFNEPICWDKKCTCQFICV